MRAELIRKDFSTLQTTGEFLVYSESGRVLFNAKTLELDVDGNKEGESCIPEGSYDMIPLLDRPESTTFNKESQGYFPYLVDEVPNRTGILFHHGNFYPDILGCVLLGEEFYDIDEDGVKDVTNSRATMKELNKVLKTTVDLDIKRSNIGRADVDSIYINEHPFN